MSLYFLVHIVGSGDIILFWFLLSLLSSLVQSILLGFSLPISLCSIALVVLILFVQPGRNLYLPVLIKFYLKSDLDVIEQIFRKGVPCISKRDLLPRLSLKNRSLLKLPLLLRSANNAKSRNSYFWEFFPWFSFSRRSEIKYQLQNRHFSNNHYFESDILKSLGPSRADKSSSFMYP